MEILKSFTITCAYFSHKRCFSLATTRCQTCLFLAISHKDKAFTKQMMQLIANLDDDSVNHLCSLGDYSLKQQLFEYLQE